jgi:hypothetical protein
MLAMQNPRQRPALTFRPPRTRAENTVGRKDQALPRHLLKLWLLVGLIAMQQAVRAEPPPNLPKPHAPVIPADPTECDHRLGQVAVFIRQSPVEGPGECVGEDLVKLEAVTMPDRSFVAIAPAAILRCSMAEAVAEFVRKKVGPAASELGAPLLSVETAASYDCRNRNNLQAAKISEHAGGNALDISGVRLKNHASYELASVMTPEAFRTRFRDAACHSFTTVLGPGSDPYHAEHIHLDRAERRNGYRICQWDVREIIPLPPPRPAELAGKQADPEEAEPRPAYHPK